MQKHENLPVVFNGNQHLCTHYWKQNPSHTRTSTATPDKAPSHDSTPTFDTQEPGREPNQGDQRWSRLASFGKFNQNHVIKED